MSEQTEGHETYQWLDMADVPVFDQNDPDSAARAHAYERIAAMLLHEDWAHGFMSREAVASAIAEAAEHVRTIAAGGIPRSAHES